MKRMAMRRHKSRRLFKRTAGHHKRNYHVGPMRGGIRM